MVSTRFSRHNLLLVAGFWVLLSGGSSNAFTGGTRSTSLAHEWPSAWIGTSSTERAPPAPMSVVVQPGALSVDRHHPDSPNPAERAAKFLRGLGIWGPLAFILLFVVLCVACVPSVFLTIAAGAVFGFGWGFAVAWLGAQLGASVAFFISRRVAHDWVHARLARLPYLSAVEEAVSIEGWRIVGLLRLAPGSPFFLLNYVFGLSRVKYRDYVWATAISSIPGTLLFVYLGSVGQMAVSGRIRTGWDWLLYGVGLVAIVVATALVTLRARRVLDARIAGAKQRVPEGGASE